MQNNKIITEEIKSVKGMNDILPNESYAWLWLENILQEWLESFGYENIRTPIVESTNLFVRSIGKATDIVEKEMYSWTDHLNEDKLTLRPEGTAGVVRAAIEHNLLYNNIQKLWYIGPMFRHERPQKGRYRQFYQLGVEALGLKGPSIDCEIILMLNNLWQRLGINDLELQINCLGNKAERSEHRKVLIDYFEKNIDLLDKDANRRLHSNPLRILDSKNPLMQDLIVNAPKLIDFLKDESLAHYTNWKNLLTELNIKFTENPYLVRGLDYYNLSVFEWVTTHLGAQATIAAGGRYDPLIEVLGGKKDYAIGFAIGIERLLLILEYFKKIPLKKPLNVFIANNYEFVDSKHSALASYSFKIANMLRDHAFNVLQDLTGNSLKSQLKKADNLNVSFTLLIGENELSNNQVVIKFMKEHKQEIVALDQLVGILIKHSSLI